MDITPSSTETVIIIRPSGWGFKKEYDATYLQNHITEEQFLESMRRINVGLSLWVALYKMSWGK